MKYYIYILIIYEILYRFKGEQISYGRKAMANIDSIKKQRHNFANKGPNS